MDTLQFMQLNGDFRMNAAFSELSRYEDYDDYDSSVPVNMLQDNLDDTTAF